MPFALRTVAAAALVVSALAAMASPRVARAQDRVAMSQVRYQRGLACFHRGDHACALAELTSALELYDSPNTRLVRARALRASGRNAEAYVEFDRSARDAEALSEQSPRYAATAQTARAERDALRARVAWVRVTVSPAPPAEARVTIADREFPVGVIGLPTPVDPGAVTVRVEARGYLRAERTATLAAGAQQDLAIALAAAPVAPPRGSPTARTPGERHPMPATRAAGLVLLGVGVAGGAVFTGLAVAARADFDQLTAANCEPPEPPCARELARVRDRGVALETSANVALGIGIAALVAGVVLVALPAPRARPPVGVAVVPGGVVLRGAF